jgi:hypothetical protein
MLVGSGPKNTTIFPRLATRTKIRYRETVSETVSETYRNQWILSLQLLVWGAGSIILGTLFLVTGGPFLRGIGLQALIWGVVDACLAGFGARRAWKRSREAPDEYRTTRDALRLVRILRINTALDVVYIAVGITVAVLFRANPFGLGNGVGVIIQGAFLLGFDAVHGWRLPAEPPPWYDPAV